MVLSQHKIILLACQNLFRQTIILKRLFIPADLHVQRSADIA
ncbi:hypothetical protein CGLO_12358 [Colletotrichum gloeosporioides Cg-14]|uniref:Uncharacterized protein n=1 Tax=Colletotrichum gloeosporioides (strain Cg-14) TaxID=1237896 RepID=T0JYT6_COLGC|nr:hypothetical protein CGLO_12358 [Colletotrichum gloeosporioides Cg-14]